MLSDSYQLKIPSHRKVLNIIRLHTEISGAEIARLVGLQPSTLVYILRSLRQRQFIKISRIGTQQGGAGKPPTLWRLVPEKGYVIGLEVIPNEIRATVIDFACKTVFQDTSTFVQTVGKDNLAKSIVTCIRHLLEKVTLPTEKIIGAGIALTGLIDRKNGVIRYSRKLNVQNYPIQSELNEHFEFPLEIVNDANAGALGLKWHLGTMIWHHDHVVFLTLNEKIGYMGAGLVLSNRLFEGAHGTAGELTASIPSLHTLIEKGCQRYGNEQPITAFKKEKGDILIEDVIELTNKDCQVCHFVLRQYSQFIATEVVRSILFINPDMIVLGGDITNARDLILDSILDKVKKRLQRNFPTGIAIPDIHFAESGIYSVSLGATSLMLRRIFMPDTPNTVTE